MQRIFKNQCVPETLQSDNEGKCKNAVKILQEKLNQSDQVPSHHNSKAQVKVESSDCVLRGKVYYNMIQHKREGVNKVKNQLDNMKCISIEKREKFV